MNRNRARTARILAWSLLLVLALRPSAQLRRLTGLLVAPASLAAELASPLALLRRGRVLAAEERVARGLSAEVEESSRILADLAGEARPSEPRLREGRRLIHGESLGPSASSRDRIRVRLADLRGVQPGLPVASGDAYVGRVSLVPPVPAAALGRATLPGVIEVELVTARGFHVGAWVERPGAEDVLMTVGGLDEIERGGRRKSATALRLAVHHPSDRAAAEGLARVHELFADAERFSALSEGLRLGRLRRTSDDGRVFLEPELDYEDGLSHLVVLAPPDEALPDEVLRDPSLLDTHWLQVSPLSVADPSPWRESAKLRAGTRDGVRVGAAVALGPRLVGRVARVGHATCDVSFVGDPGFSVVAVARFEGEDEPRVLGRLVSLGRDASGEHVLLRWKARVPLALGAGEGTVDGTLRVGDGTRRARIFSGSGDPGLGSGFFLGEALVPVATDEAEPVITLVTGLVPADFGTLHVRLDPDEPPGASGLALARPTAGGAR